MKTTLRAAAAFSVVLLAAACSSGGGAAEPAEPDASPAEASELVELTIAEPVHGVGYLPLYAAQDKGYFAEQGLEVEVTTLTGGGHVNATLAGEVAGFIGGPESGAVANVKGADLVAVANVVNRGNVYFVAAEGAEPEAGADIGEYLAGKTIVGGRYGGTPNAILRHILQMEGLDPESDVTLMEVEDSSAIPSVVAQGQAEVAVVAEPQLGLGIQQGLWGEPFLNPLDLLGPYAYSAIVMPRATVEEQPETVAAFVAALEQGQAAIEEDRAYATDLASRQFPTMEPDVLEATLERAYADELWGGTYLTQEAVETALEVARSGDILDDSAAPQTYEVIADNQFVSEEG
ncbi:ABC transporter substrate-binding protein [Cellulomonas sp. APG4]|uniref:ABC transporter substrate-binding protein n=1 Tax=Cellulomonas sp. APG4 TaxID=1538656 RepID=UPI0013795AE4|nr:ABC transporter substrate-binding protein [Cellulomonas sp. APG4]NCT91266.1 ABC transporter substrate-binding protein [Cellulomonas sp. APG4]